MSEPDSSNVASGHVQLAALGAVAWLTRAERLLLNAKSDDSRTPARSLVHAALGVIDMERYPVDIRGHVTFGRLLSGLSQVGLTVRIDPRTGRVVITDDMYEPA